MPTFYAIEAGFVVVSLSGHFTIEESLQTCREAFVDPAFVTGMPLLIDLRESQDEVSPDDLEQSAAFISENRYRIGPRHALVAADDERFDRASVHSLRTIQLGRVSTRVFTSYEDAVAWICHD